jgi:hypothetical protein
METLTTSLVSQKAILAILKQAVRVRPVSHPSANESWKSSWRFSPTISRICKILLPYSRQNLEKNKTVFEPIENSEKVFLERFGTISPKAVIA